MLALQEARRHLDENLDSKALEEKAAAEVESFIEAFLRPYLGERILEIRYE
ncbi:MAG: hypothetical protein J6S76_01510 [Clostridia bacterium]|nr:hypothetical protein [Clostridia bacterium]